MTFDSVETSEYFQPIELFAFTRGTQAWYYTSSDHDIEYSGSTYLALPIKRGKIRGTQDLGRSPLQITITRRASLLEQYIQSSPADTISVVLTRIHESDPDPAITWRGKITNVRFKENEAEIECQSIQAVLRRPGLRRTYQANCPHLLYGDQCQVVRQNFDTFGVITNISGTVLTSPAFVISINPSFDNDWFVGGYIEFTSGGITDRRFITAHDNGAGTITVNYPFATLTVGQSVTAFAGCAHNTTHCRDKFSNIVNYGGFPLIPSKNPMGGTSVF